MEPAVAGPIVKPLIVTVNAADVLMVAAGLLERQSEKNELLLPVDGCCTRVHELGIRVPSVSPEDTAALRSPDDDT